jgi:hypothetical protein
MSNHEWVDGLRELADWLEQNPDVTIGPRVRRIEPFLTCKDATVGEARAFAAEHGFNLWNEYTDEIDGVVREVAFARSFGPLTVDLWGEDVPSEEWLEEHRIRRPRLLHRIKAVFS